MTILDVQVPGELRLTLRGAEENAILATLRRWPHWIGSEVQRDPANAQRCLTVTLITDRNHEPIIREILRRSFGLIFPPEGGELTYTPEPPPVSRRRHA